MNKKRLVAGLLTSATVVGLFAAGGTAFAAEVDTHDTTLGIGFSDHSTPPGTGDLTMKWAPIKFNFGTSNQVNTVANAFSEESGVKKYVVVSDARAESGADKWDLTAKISNIASGPTQLVGATLSFDTAKQAYQGVDAPEAPGSIIAPTLAHTAVVSANQTLAQGATATVVMSDDGSSTSSYKGMTALEMDNIELNVPANAAEAGKQYTGTLTWSLDDTI
ncbi:WxL domain-containing protein [Enterococcus hulanensis]|uniref:WxL domain-containing protein n=1 Tax=Enterococcus hulanensis TaxID=2559929 RepID=UPI001A90069D|nr:WxL domain-containing protein [Enterococcus hulanensis]MBO0459899.1 WxL domain-containing protein [Enterococcus hulanensis]